MPTVASTRPSAMMGAIVAPTGTPPDIVTKVNNAVNAFLKSDKGKTILEQNALQAVGGSPEDLKALIAGERAKNGGP
ncbi:MAG TPA: tripartite tricarboxylate transporter substrate-binding protein [Bradyrhizobium sp.]|jgi:tripartite-type tricarboxylate transporter receptor subunit TctC